MSAAWFIAPVVIAVLVVVYGGFVIVVCQIIAGPSPGRSYRNPWYRRQRIMNKKRKKR